MQVTRKIIRIDEELCDGCGQCVPGCAEGALQMVDGKARVVEDRYCDGLGACINECPNGALTIIERKADEFDEKAVEVYLAKKEKEEPKEDRLPCGCPSTQLQSFIPRASCETADEPATIEAAESSLAHWPVQIKLVPPNAPFLKDADLLVIADCVPVAYPALHRDFLQGKAVMMGCPKFDDVEEYIEKFTQVFKTACIKSVTSVIMEVPCCSGLPEILKRGLEAAAKEVPMEEKVISLRGKIL